MILLLLTLFLQTPPPNFADCVPANPTRDVCLYIDVVTPLTTHPVDGLPQRIQYLPRVNVKVSQSSWYGTRTQTVVTDGQGRAVVQVVKGRGVTVRSDASDKLVVLPDAQGLPQPHRYVDVVLTHTLSQKNERLLMTLKLDPAVAVLK